MPDALPPPQLDPQAQGVLRLMQDSGAPPIQSVSVADARKGYLKRTEMTRGPAAVMAEVHELQAAGPAGAIPLRLYRSEGAPDVAPVLVYLHGGGWLIGDLDSHDHLCRDLAAQSGCCVVAVDYRLAPEHRFPAAADDAVAAVRWVRQHAADLGLDAGRMAIGGDSAGGNLAAVACLALRDAGELQGVRWQLLIYPAVDLVAQTAAYRDLSEGYLLTTAAMTYFRDQYLGGDDGLLTDWRASPIRHPSLAGLPPAWIVTAGYDPLRDDGRAYADALTLAGTPAQMICFERQMHGFVLMGGVLDEARTAVSLCALGLRQALMG